ncbi:TonB-dependent siderophore receptor [Hyphomicrobium sp.]|uniref:TonB-dependent receptor n=1 Tax=Hyphomicrobium sp. TaxID=82 RepID=UPI0025C226FD|nr:TonB-dependent siderophore receptor [Hyphomicrobium sp.]MCC7250487.1 TonB-dependent siderophore receptor [Hyphomicrobium sp.]
MGLGAGALAQEAAAPAELPPLEVTAQAKKKAVPAKKKSATSPVPQAPVAVAAPEQTATEDAGDADGGLSSGGVDGYRATRSATGTKTDTPLIDIPQAITVITQERAQDQRAVDVNKALQYVPGVIVAQGEGNRDQIVVRGQNTTADFFVDGVRDDVQYFRDLYNADRLEVLKGPNAMIFGRGGGGGVINRVTKKAGEDVREGTAWVGSFDHYRATADVGARVSNDFAVRLNGVFEDSGSYRNGVDLERYGINPTAFFRLTDDTRLWLSYEYFKDERTVDRGISSVAVPGSTERRPYPGSIKAFFGDPDKSISDFEGHTTTATIEHKFSEDLKIRNHTSYGDFDKFYDNVYAATAVVGGLYTAGVYDNLTTRTTLVNQTDVTYTFDGGWYGHTLVVGTEFSRQDTDNTRKTGANYNGPGGLGIPASDPTFTLPAGYSIPVTGRNATELTTASVYIQDQLDLTKYFQVIGGIRFDRFDIDATNVLSGADFGRVDDVWSPRIGIVVKPTDGLSLYASYSKSFLPYSGEQFPSLDGTTQDLEPEEFINREIGFKWEVAPRLLLSAALYQLDRENTRAVNPANAALPPVQIGSSRTEGGEIELVGNITDNWEVAVGYARTFGEITGAQGTTVGNTVPVGRSLANIPEDMFTLWNKYQFTPMFAAGIGVVHRSEMFASTDNRAVLPEFTRVDGALYFNLTENLDAQLNVENIFDEKYYASAHNEFNITPGSPRAFYFGVTSRF